MARTREQRRGTQYTGILRGSTSSREARPAPSQIEERPGFRWRMVSGVIVLLLSGLLFLFFYADAFYVTSIRVGGVDTMTVEEIFAYANIANWHIFWVRPDQVRENVMQYPSVADAQVQIGWPPNMITINIQEREPALVWEQNSVARWVDIQGNIMNMRMEVPNLVRVIVDDPALELPTGSNAIDTDIVFGVLELHELRPDVTEWRYRPNDGLGFRNENGWDVWFGVGTGMAEKMQIYESLASRIIARGIQASEMFVVNPDAPYYNVLWGR
jgi:cell division septal protein FtsQ